MVQVELMCASPHFLIQLTLYGCGCGSSLRLSAWTSFEETMFLLLPLSIMTLQTLPLIVQRVRNNKCRWGWVSVFYVRRIRRITKDSCSPSSDSNSFISSSELRFASSSWLSSSSTYATIFRCRHWLDKCLFWLHRTTRTLYFPDAVRRQGQLQNASGKAFPTFSSTSVRMLEKSCWETHSRCKLKINWDFPFFRRSFGWHHQCVGITVWLHQRPHHVRRCVPTLHRGNCPQRHLTCVAGRSSSRHSTRQEY